MVPEEEISSERFPATCFADVLFGAVSGAILASIAGMVTTRLLVPSSPPYLSILMGAIIGAVTGAVAGSIHHSRRTTFNSSQLGVPLAIAFALIPSLILFLNAFSIAGGTSVKSVAAVGFAGVMVGMLLGATLDRVYETILKRTTRDGS